jgi:A/G-specific adenine glycosylase
MQFAQKLLRWHEKKGRKNLPWQKNITPYRVWVSEIMLQQTQVSTVIRYYDKFLQRFPELSILAATSLDDVFHVWAGLGYYARAKNLHRAAQIIATEKNGVFPTDFETVLSLPGIGRSTAGAILAISDNQMHPILDGNVKRVLSRYFAVKGVITDPKILQKLWRFSESVMPKKQVATYTQAIMDLGATLCTRTKPSCLVCPLKADCRAYHLGKVSHFPQTRTATKKLMPIRSTKTIILLNQTQQTILLEKRPIRGIWGGLWSFPECTVEMDLKNFCQQTFDLKISTEEALEPLRHTFTHFHLNIHPVICQLKRVAKNLTLDKKYQWHPLHETHKLGLPAPIKRLLEKIK